jgi:hypothetical protein
MRSNTPLWTTAVLGACLCVMLALSALPLRARRAEEPPRAAAQLDTGRGSEARFEKRLPLPVPDTSALWRKLTLERILEQRAARCAPLFFALPCISDARARPSAAQGDPFGPEAVEASAPAIRVVGRGNVAGVWEGATVPLDALGAPSRWLTPSVGRVRAELADGTAFEGRLHSIGEGKVWIENELGRMALLGAQIRTLRQLPPQVGETPATELPALPLVHVRTPGGLFQGRLLRREDGRVTLLTAEGGQVTLDDAEVEPIPPGQAARRP